MNCNDKVRGMCTDTRTHLIKCQPYRCARGQLAIMLAIIERIVCVGAGWALAVWGGM